MQHVCLVVWCVRGVWLRMRLCVAHVGAVLRTGVGVPAPA